MKKKTDFKRVSLLIGERNCLDKPCTLLWTLSRSNLKVWVLDLSTKERRSKYLSIPPICWIPKLSYNIPLNESGVLVLKNREDLRYNLLPDLKQPHKLLKFLWPWEPPLMKPYKNQEIINKLEMRDNWSCYTNS